MGLIPKISQYVHANTPKSPQKYEALNTLGTKNFRKGILNLY